MGEFGEKEILNKMNWCALRKMVVKAIVGLMKLFCLSTFFLIVFVVVCKGAEWLKETGFLDVAGTTCLGIILLILSIVFVIGSCEKALEEWRECVKECEDE